MRTPSSAHSSKGKNTPGSSSTKGEKLRTPNTVQMDIRSFKAVHEDLEERHGYLLNSTKEFMRRLLDDKKASNLVAVKEVLFDWPPLVALNNILSDVTSGEEERRQSRQLRLAPPSSEFNTKARKRTGVEITPAKKALKYSPDVVVKTEASSPTEDTTANVLGMSTARRNFKNFAEDLQYARGKSSTSTANVPCEVVEVEDSSDEEGTGETGLHGNPRM